MNLKQKRRNFLRQVSLFPLCAAAGLPWNRANAAQEPIKRHDGPRLKIALNACSFSKALNDNIKRRGPGMTLSDLLDFWTAFETAKASEWGAPDDTTKP